MQFPGTRRQPAYFLSYLIEFKGSYTQKNTFIRDNPEDPLKMKILEMVDTLNTGKL